MEAQIIQAIVPYLSNPIFVISLLIIGIVYYIFYKNEKISDSREKRYTALVEETRKESVEREDKLYRTIDNLHIIIDNSLKDNTVAIRDLANRVDSIEKVID